MQRGPFLSFKCQSCEQSVLFSVLELNKQQGCVECKECHSAYAFADETLRRQLIKFEALCRQIADSEEILSQTSVGIHVAGQEVRIPYRILLTRLNSKLDLTLDGQKLTIEFRLEPCKDLHTEDVGS